MYSISGECNTVQYNTTNQQWSIPTMEYNTNLENAIYYTIEYRLIILK